MNAPLSAVVPPSTVLSETLVPPPSLTAKYLEEFNQGAFGGALSDVRVTWSTRLKSTAGVTKSLRRSSVSGGFTYVSAVELSTKVLDSETKLRQVCVFGAYVFVCVRVCRGGWYPILACGPSTTVALSAASFSRR